MDNMKSVMSGLVTGPDHYLEPSRHLIKLCGCILGDTKYAVTVEKRFEKNDSPKKVAVGTLKPTMLKIALAENSTTLGEDEREEIELKLIVELKQQLGEVNYRRLVVSSGVTSHGSYCINLNRQELYSLSLTLEKLADKMEGENQGTRLCREQDFAFKKANLKVDAEIKNAASKVNETESLISQANSQEYFQLLTTQYTVNKMVLSDAMARKELLSAMRDNVGTTPEIMEHIIQLYLTFMRYREAVYSDVLFQNKLFQKYPDKTIEKIMEDPDRRIECFVYYIEENPQRQNTLKTIFNSADPEINNARFETYKGCADKIALASKSNDNMVLSGKIGDAISHCYSYVLSEEKKYIEPAGCLIDASHFLLGYPHFNYEPQFEHFDQETKNVVWPLKSIKLEARPCEQGVIQGEQDFNDYVEQLKNLLGEARFHRLVRSTELISSLAGQTYCLYLDPAELQTVTLYDLIQDLSPNDLKMYSMMRVEKLKGNEEKNKIDRVALMYKDFVAMYEIYAKFKIAEFKIATSVPNTTPISNTQVALTLDPDFFVGPELDNNNSQLSNFIQFIKSNRHYLNRILEIFNTVSPQENRAKCESYVKQCEMKSRFSIGDELAKNWFFALGQLVKWCATVADLQYLLNLNFPKFVQLQEFGQQIDMPSGVLSLIFERLFVIEELSKKANA